MLCAITLASWLFTLNKMLLTAGAPLFLGVVLCVVAWDAWRTYTPRGFALFLLMCSCLAFAGICALDSTWPSSAPRKEVTGIITWIVIPREVRKKDTVGLALPNGSVLSFRAIATPPLFAKDRDLVTVTYLDDKPADSYRAIGFRVLNGPQAGYHRSVNADWLGSWLGVIFGLLMGFGALDAARRSKRLNA